MFRYYFCLSARAAPLAAFILSLINARKRNGGAILAPYCEGFISETA